MTTLVNTAVTAIIASLSSAVAVAPQISRVHLRPLAQGVGSVVIVRPLRSDPSQRLLSGAPVSWLTAVGVECYARATPAMSPDEAVDPLVEAVYARLMADPTLGGAVVALQPEGIVYDFDADADKTVCATFTFTVYQRGSETVFN